MTHLHTQVVSCIYILVRDSFMHTSSRDVSCIYISVPDPFMYINS